MACLLKVAVQSWSHSTPMLTRECRLSSGSMWALVAVLGRVGQLMLVVPIDWMWWPLGIWTWMGGSVVSVDDACCRKWPVVLVSAMAVEGGGGGGGGVRVLARRLSSLEVTAGTLHPHCQVVVGLLASLPPIVFSRVALSWWPGALFWQVALVCLFPTQ